MEWGVGRKVVGGSAWCEISSNLFLSLSRRRNWVASLCRVCVLVCCWMIPAVGPVHVFELIEPGIGHHFR